MNHTVLRDLATYLVDEFDFDAAEQRLNELQHLRGPIRGQNLHCVVYRGSGKRMPLLLIHGWPGSFVEFLDAAELLAEHYDLVIPSLPGFAFSDPAEEAGMDGGRIADRLHSLMVGLTYDSYGVQGGDWGAVIGTALALRQPDAVTGLHLNLIPSPPATPERETPSPAEQEFLEFRRGWDYENLGYYQIQATRPQTLSYALQDSPVGLLAWMVEKFWAWSDHSGDLWKTFDRDQVLTNMLLYWIPGRVLSSSSIYYEMMHPSSRFLEGRVEVPTGYARFPKEPWGSSPRDGGAQVEPGPLHRAASGRALRRHGAA